MTTSLAWQPRASAAAQPRAKPTELLSLECQKRHFNLEWIVKTTNEGRICADVLLRNVLVKGNTSHKELAEAKYATAEKALREVRSMPVYHPAAYSSEARIASARTRSNPTPSAIPANVP